MRRSVAFAAALLTIAGVAGQSAGAGSSSSANRVLPMALMGEHYANPFSLPEPPAGQTPEQRARWILDRPMLGRSPQAWMDWTHDTFAIESPRLRAPATGDAGAIADAVRSIEAAVGVPQTDRAALARDAGRIPASVRAPFAELTGVVARAYAVQRPLGLVVAARMNAGAQPHELLTIAERDLMSVLQTQITDALNVFRARTSDWVSAEARGIPHVTAAGGTDPPLFADPEGLVILGGLGNATYNRGGTILDPVLLVEPAGSDLYNNSAGGACPVTITQSGRWMECNSLALSVVADLGDDTSAPSDDSYQYNGLPAAVQGAGGPGGIGILVDVAGDDIYYAKMTRGNTNYFLTYYFDGGAQGFGYAGNGLLVDGLGNDVYRFEIASSAGKNIWALSQGFGGAGGLGIAADVSGNDQWLTYGLGGTNFQGIYSQGVGFYGGVGISSDTGLGTDLWFGTVTSQGVDYYAQGGAFGGLGFMYDDGGNDDYYSYEKATTANGPLNPLLNCAFGTASFFGVGIAVDSAGDDSYYGESVPVAGKGSAVMDNGFGGPGQAYGLFVDTGGNDTYTSIARGTPALIQGRGYWEDTLTNTWGTFVDIGGIDTYTGGFGANNTQWQFGVDRGV